MCSHHDWHNSHQVPVGVLIEKLYKDLVHKRKWKLQDDMKMSSSLGPGESMEEKASSLVLAKSSLGFEKEKVNQSFRI